MTVLREFLPLYRIPRKPNLISFSYLPRPSNWQSMIEIDISAMAKFSKFCFLMTFTLNSKWNSKLYDYVYLSGY